MATSTVGTLISTYVSDLGDVLTNNLPTILGVAAALFGLVLIVKYAKRFIR